MDTQLVGGCGEVILGEDMMGAGTSCGDRDGADGDMWVMDGDFAFH